MSLFNLPFFISIPHSGEKIPPEAKWLESLSEVVLMGDVDRYVDRLYSPAIEKFRIPSVKTEWHRYAADLNRVPTDVDCESLEGDPRPGKTNPLGFHWGYNTQSEKILPKPLTKELHEKLIERVYKPFHDQVKKQYADFHSKGFERIFHIDAHSMPSLGTSQHRDPGQKRAHIVVSDSKGKSCMPEFKDLVISSYQKAGFEVAYNWPYFGGRLTEQYGEPTKNHHVVQVELNRSLYMNESTKQWVPELAGQVMPKLEIAISHILNGIPALASS